jgi:hypothetical protein
MLGHLSNCGCYEGLLRFLLTVTVGPDVALIDMLKFSIMNTTKITPDIFFSSLLFLFPLILLMHRYHLLKLLFTLLLLNILLDVYLAFS